MVVSDIVMVAQGGMLRMVELLLDKNAYTDGIGIEHHMDKRYKEFTGDALHKAADEGHDELAKFLIDKE